MHTLETLSEIDDAKEFGFAFRNFLDAFYASPSATLLQQIPRSEDPLRNAYLAATGDYLCNKYDLARPPWLWRGAEGDRMVADPPWFASDYWKTRILLLAESPQEFRQRGIFIGADALSRT